MDDTPDTPVDSDAESPPLRGRALRLETHERNPKWTKPALEIDMSMCINCDACMRHCPPQFGAIFNHGIDVIIVAELCSGCGKCLDPCPVNCIVESPGSGPSPPEFWQTVARDDPYR